jgi:hypothetical protein
MITAKENKNMKKTYNAASAFATKMSTVLGKMDVFEDYEEMNDDILDKINATTVENASGCSKENADGSDGESSSNNSHNLHQRKDRNQIYQVRSKLLGKTVTMMMILFLRGMMMMMMMMMIMMETEMKKKSMRTEVIK